MGRLAACTVAAVLLSAGCGSGGASPAPSPSTSTITGTRPAPSGAIHSAPTRASSAPLCPLLGRQSAADKVGMRLARITVLTSGGATVGCRFYALQGSPLSRSEHLPGPHQPAIEILLTRYRSALAAHNAVVRLGQRQGTNPQQASIVGQAPGLCFQTDFAAGDNGTDWACAFSTGTVMVVVRTVVTSPALNAILVSRAVASHI